LYVNRRMYFLAAVKADFAYRAKGDYARLKCKKRVVFAEPHVFTRHHAGAALAHQYVAYFSHFTGIKFNAQVFWL